MTNLAHQQRCPALKYELWEQICNGPERCWVDLTLDTNEVLRSVFFADGVCLGSPTAEQLGRTVAVKILPENL